MSEERPIIVQEVRRENVKAVVTALGITIPILLGVGGLLRASLDRMDDRLDRSLEYFVNENTTQWNAIAASERDIAVLTRELEIWKRFTTPQPHQAGEDSYD